MASTENSKKPSDTVDARIIGNWGDPGLSESGLHDFLSRFLVVQIIRQDGEIACERNWHKTIAIVLRPPSLWVFAGTEIKDRFDYFGVKNVQTNEAEDWGQGALYEADVIQPITPAYKLGDIITIKKLKEGFFKDRPVGESSVDVTSNLFYNNIPYDLFRTLDTRVPNQVEEGEGEVQPISSSSYRASAGFTIELPLCAAKISDEKCLMRYEGGEIYLKTLQKVLNGTIEGSTSSSGPDAAGIAKEGKKGGGKYDIGEGSSSTAFLNGNELIKALGGVLTSKEISYVTYIDMNTISRSRPIDSGCIPNVIVSPSTFPSPQKRNLGSILVSLLNTSGTTGSSGTSGTSG